MDDREVLLERAKRLARVEKREEKIASFFEGIAFRLGRETYMIEYDYVLEVYPLKEIVRTPLVPKFIAGLINVRSRIVTLVDLKEIFGLERQKGEKGSVALLLGLESASFALMADESVGLMTFPESEIQSSLLTLTGVKKEFLKGFTKDGVIILDGRKILKSPRFRVDEKI